MTMPRRPTIPAENPLLPLKDYQRNPFQVESIGALASLG